MLKGKPHCRGGFARALRCIRHIKENVPCLRRQDSGAVIHLIIRDVECHHGISGMSRAKHQSSQYCFFYGTSAEFFYIHVYDSCDYCRKSPIASPKADCHIPFNGKKSNSSAKASHIANISFKAIEIPCIFDISSLIIQASRSTLSKHNSLPS